VQLTRRDAAAALAALGSGGAVALAAREWRGTGGRAGGAEDDGAGPDGGAGSDDDPDLADDRQVRDAMVAVAEVVYPSEVAGIEAFVEGFLAGRLEREGHAEGLRRAVADLDRLAEAWYDGPVAALSPADRDSLLRETGARTAEEVPDPAHVPAADPTAAERIRYYVLNDLLLALYASPTGGELVGIENPQGHAGGTDSYQRGPGR